MNDLILINQMDVNIIDNICSSLSCNQNEIENIEFIKIGLTNISFKFSVRNNRYVYRHPGNGTSLLIDRKSEAFAEEIASNLGIDSTLVEIDSEKGWKISKFIENSTQINPYDKNDQIAAIKLIKKLHEAEVVSPYDFDYHKEMNKLIDYLEEHSLYLFDKYKSIIEQSNKVNYYLNQTQYKKILCHNDFWYWNILKDSNNKLVLIDWEYAGNYYPAADVAYYTSSLDFSIDDYYKLAELYEEHELTIKEKRYYIGVFSLVMWYWVVWAIYKETIGKTINDKDMWFEKAKEGFTEFDRLSSLLG